MDTQTTADPPWYWKRADPPCDEPFGLKVVDNGVQLSIRCDRPAEHEGGHSSWTTGFVYAWS